MDFHHGFEFLHGGMRNIRHARSHRRRHGGHRGRDGIDGWAMLLLIDLGGRIINMPNKPPVTLGIMLGCISIHFLPFIADYVNLSSVCLIPAAILFDIRRGRLLNVAARTLGSPFFHASDLHLVYNMGALFMRGSTMEQGEGSRLYAIMVVQVLILSQVLIIFASVVLAKLADMEELNHACIVGFSGVLFALKYIQSQRNLDQMQHIMSFRIPSRYVVWAELLIIRLVVPNSSLLGHLCGILAGVLYENVQFLRETLSNIISEAFSTIFLTVRPSYTYASGRAAARPVSPSVGREYSFPSSGSDDTTGDEALAAEEERMVQEATRLSLLDIDEFAPPVAEPTSDLCASVASSDADSWVEVLDVSQAGEEKKEEGISGSQERDCSSELRQRRISHFLNR